MHGDIAYNTGQKESRGFITLVGGQSFDYILVFLVNALKGGRPGAPLQEC